MTRAQLLAICEPFVRQLAGEVIGLVHAHIEAQLAGVRASAVEQLTAKLAALGERDLKPDKSSKPKRKTTRPREPLRAKKPVKPPPPAVKSAPTAPKQHTCSVCGEPGHNARRCPEREDSEGAVANVSPSPVTNGKSDRFARIEAQAKQRAAAG